MLNRRTFIASMGAMAGTLMCRPSASDTEAVGAAVARRRLSGIGIQLYAVRKVLATDFEGTLAQLAGIGYKKVEFAGYYNRTPTAIRAILDKNGLTSPSAHIDLNSLRTQLGAVADAARIMGHEYVTMPWLEESARGKTPDDWKRLAQELNEIADRLKARNLKFAYHNHDFELRPVGAQIPLDVLLANTQPDLVKFQLDLYWAVNAGHDPRAYVQRYPGRFTMLHIKDSAGAPKHDQTDVGRGTIDFASVLRADADVEHVFVEHDDPPNPIEFARNSFAYLEKLEF